MLACYHLNDDMINERNAALHCRIDSHSNISISKRHACIFHSLNTRLEKVVYLRLFLSTRASITFELRSKWTSRTPKRCQSRSRRTRSWRTLPRPMLKQSVLLAGLMCKKRESQFICMSSGPVRGALSVPFSGPRSKPERMEEELKFTAPRLLGTPDFSRRWRTYYQAPWVACPCLP
jgi:hypothetical protein